MYTCPTNIPDVDYKILVHVLASLDKLPKTYSQHIWRDVCIVKHKVYIPLIDNFDYQLLAHTNKHIEYLIDNDESEMLCAYYTLNFTIIKSKLFNIIHQGPDKCALRCFKLIPLDYDCLLSLIHIAALMNRIHIMYVLLQKDIDAKTYTHTDVNNYNDRLVACLYNSKYNYLKNISVADSTSYLEMFEKVLILMPLFFHKLRVVVTVRSNKNIVY